MPRTRTLAAALAALAAAPAAGLAAASPSALVLRASALPAGYVAVTSASGPVSQAEAIARASTSRLRALTRRHRLAGYRAVFRRADPAEQSESRSTLYRSPRGAALVYVEGLRILDERAERLEVPPIAPGARAFLAREQGVEAVVVAWRRGPAVLTVQVSGPSVAPAAATRLARRQDARAVAALGLGPGSR